ncbi:MAG: hypothetical protein Q9222_005875 [Ikaeria aurantiellina]
MADRIESRRAPLLAGLLTMTASTLLYCFSISPYMLAVARALQGTSAVLIWVVGLALLVDTMGAADSGYAMGWTTVAWCLGSTIGPFTGGVVYDLAGHYAVFGVAFAVLGFDIFLRDILIERRDAEKWNAQVKTQSYGTMADDSPSEAASRDTKVVPDTAPDASADDGTAVTSTSTPTSSQSSHLPVALQLLLNVRILANLFGAFALSCSICALETVLPLYTQRVFNWSPTLSGACLTVLSGPIIIDPFIGKLAASPKKRKVLAGLGFALGSVAFFALTAVTESATVVRKSLLWGMLGVVGLGYSLTATPVMLDISTVVEANEKRCPGIYGPGKGVATSFALYNVATASGSLVGPAVAGWEKQTIGWTGLCMSLGIVFAITAATATLFCGGWIGQKESVESVEEH